MAHPFAHPILFPLFRYWRNIHNFPFSARTSDSFSSFLFLSHLLSLRPNYMADRVIDTGESESPQQAAWGPSYFSSVDPYTYTCTLESHLDFLQTWDRGLPIPTADSMLHKQRKCITTSPPGRAIHISWKKKEAVASLLSKCLNDKTLWLNAFVWGYVCLYTPVFLGRVVIEINQTPTYNKHWCWQAQKIAAAHLACGVPISQTDASPLFYVALLDQLTVTCCCV